MARRFVEGLGLPWQQQHQIWMGGWLPHEIKATDAVWSRADMLADRAGDDQTGRAMYLDQRMYLADGVLVKVDRAAGAYGIEVRSPFLDHSIVELAASMGTGHHIRGMTNKRVLRAAMAPLLPDTVRSRPKKGFGTPVGPWLRGSSRSLLQDLPDRTAPWIPSDICAKFVTEHLNGEADHRRRLWSAIVLANWAEGPHGLG
jgi:asparagine synthase (glutamine-hydrolysing)